MNQTHQNQADGDTEELISIINQLFRLTGLPIPNSPDVFRWSQLFAAITHKNTLRQEIFNPNLITFKPFHVSDDMRTVAQVADGYPAQDQMNVLNMLDWTRWAMRRMARPDPEGDKPAYSIQEARVRYYAECHRGVVAWRDWIETEALPVVVRAITMDIPYGGDMTGLSLEGLVEEQRGTEIAYLTALFQARELRDADDGESEGVADGGHGTTSEPADDGSPRTVD